ncbi:MAG: hypothetical protein AAGI45_13485 [Cyanobacteria bacterium P01_H01_bin.26]
MTYLNQAEALARAKERSGATAADDEYLNELLTMSSALDADGLTHYRPFYCAAKWIEQNRPAQTLTEASGTKFTGLQKPIDSLLALQRSYDQANGLDVPDGFEALASDCDRCDQVGPTSQTRYRPRSVATKISP